MQKDTEGTVTWGMRRAGGWTAGAHGRKMGDEGTADDTERQAGTRT